MPAPGSSTPSRFRHGSRLLTGIAGLIAITCIPGFVMLPEWKNIQETGNQQHVQGTAPQEKMTSGLAIDTTGTAGFLIDTLATGLSVPWDILFLPDGKMLFTERPGRVRIFSNDSLKISPALTVPGIEVKGKMGLLGLCLHPGYSLNHFLYLAYNYRVGDKTFLRVARYTFENDSLLNPVTIIENIPGVFNHTGSRLKFGPDKKLYISTGDADVPALAQDLKAYNGKILRVNDDGSVPGDNPFVKNDTARKEIWTYGHRNPQGLTFLPGTAVLFDSEHGPTGGDEINLIRKGSNYGWPVAHHRDTMAGMRSPLLEFTPSVGPSESLFYSGKAFRALKGHMLVACMRGESILDIRLAGTRPQSYQQLLKKVFGRIRALAEGPDGNLYISTTMVDPPESNLTPADGGVDLLLRLRPDPVRPLPADRLSTAIFSGGNGIRLRSAATVYSQLCAGCHGDQLEGKEKIPSLVDASWNNGGTKSDIIRSITTGVTAKGMPAWKGVLTETEITQMANFILSRKKK